MAYCWSKICCPVDFSETSWLALYEAAELVGRGSGKLVLLHVFDHVGSWRSAAAGDPTVAAPEMLDERARDSARTLQRFKAEAERVAPGRVAVESVAGDAATEIVRFVQRGGFDLVVMGTHGRTGLRRLVIGSVAEKVIRHAPCSVLVVRPMSFAAEPD